MSKFNRGFTLVELLVVVAILGILSAIGVIAYNGYVSTAKKTSARNIMQQISLAQTEYFTDEGEYFESVDACDSTIVPTKSQSTEINNDLLHSAAITDDIDYHMCIFTGSDASATSTEGDTDTFVADYTIVAGQTGCVGTYTSSMEWGGCFSD